MALANDMTLLLNKIERRLGLIPLEPHLPDYLKKSTWADVIQTDTLVTFSRYFPNVFKMVINSDTTLKKKEGNKTWYYIKDEILQDTKLLGVEDIDWMDTSLNNSSLSNNGYGSAAASFYPSSSFFGCPEATFSSVIALQMGADMASLYNRGIYIDFEYPNRFALMGIGNTSYDFNTFVVKLLVEHKSLSTISPTKMEIVERLCQADIAKYLYMNLRYYDGLETVFVNIDLKLSELQDEMGKRDQVIEEIENSYVTPANDNIPYIWTV